MPELTDKTILILSPQSWGKMFISKHHYAVELARRGNKVYFLNPPEQNSKNHRAIEITPSGIENLSIISHRVWFPYRLKFHALGLFHIMMERHIRKILKVIARPVDIVWSFDLGNLYPFRFFDRDSCKIFHPVDEPLNRPAIQAAEGSDLIFSVTAEILEKYQQFPAPKFFFNHGVSGEFLLGADPDRPANNPVRVGLAGNLLRPDIDRNILLQIIEENAEVIFEFWGSFTFKQSNIGGEEDRATLDFICALQARSNVLLHGPTPLGELALAIHGMDAFLICYDIKKDQSGGTNYHKIMEYLSTGKVIVSNNVTTYKDRPDLVTMPQQRENNRELPSLFKEVISRLDEYNSSLLQAQRIGTASQNTYEKQLDRVQEALNQPSAQVIAERILNNE